MVTLIVAALTAPLAADAQSPGKLNRIGIVGNTRDGGKT